MPSNIVTETGLDEVSQAGEAIPIKGKVEKKSGKRINYHYIVVKSYKKSQKNDVVKCLYIKGLTNFGFCVIKEGSKGDTKDKEGRDVIDRLKWQRQLHEELADKIRMPRLLDSFEENGNYYLVIEHIKGRALAKEWSKQKKGLRESIMTGGKLGHKFLDYLIQITDILIALHGRGVVHRDATPNNYMITPGGKVALIDMEMCYSLETVYPTPAFRLGTHGYMSPQQEKTAIPTVAEDIYALGAIILQVWSGISPGKLVTEQLSLLEVPVPFLVVDKQVADIVVKCLDPDDRLRPGVAEIRDVLVGYREAVLKKKVRAKYTAGSPSGRMIGETIQGVIRTMSTSLMADKEQGWFANDTRPASEEDKHKLRKMYYASLDVGVSGIMIVLAKAKAGGFDVECCLPPIQSALALIKARYIDILEQKPGGLHFGAHGIAMSLSISQRHGLIASDPVYDEWIDRLCEKEGDGRSLKWGMAGVGTAILTCNQLADQPSNIQRLKQYADSLIAEQEKDGVWVSGYGKKKMFRKKKRIVDVSLGDGMSGIIQFLLQYGYRFRDEQALLAAQKGLQWMMKKLVVRNGIVSCRHTRRKELPVGRMEGVGGVAHVFLMAFEMTGDVAYADWARKLLLSIPAKYIDGNLGQRAGLAGLGEVYLEAYRILQEAEWLNRTEWLVTTILQLKRKDLKYGDYWLVEQERQPVAGWMIGNAGVLQFLLAYYAVTAGSEEKIQVEDRQVSKRAVII